MKIKINHQTLSNRLKLNNKFSLSVLKTHYLFLCKMVLQFNISTQWKFRPHMVKFLPPPPSPSPPLTFLMKVGPAWGGGGGGGDVGKKQSCNVTKPNMCWESLHVQFIWSAILRYLFSRTDGVVNLLLF